MKENVRQQTRQTESEEFIEKYRVKGGNHYCALTRKVKCRVNWGGIPESAIQVRLLEKKGVDDVVDSFLKRGIKQPMEIVAVIWEDSKNSALDVNNLVLDHTQTKPPAYINIVCGGHRTKGLQICHEYYPKKALYATVMLTLLIVPRTNANISLLLYIGNSDNRKTQVFVKTSQWSVVQQFRRNHLRFEDDESLSRKEKVDAFSAYKLETQPETGFTVNTGHTFSALCSVEHCIWERLDRIFKGEFVVNKELKGQKKPDAVTHFTSMSGIPTKKLVAWMDRILDGSWLSSTFQKRCHVFRKAERVAGQLLEHIAIQRPKYDFTAYGDAAKVYPALNDASWFDGVVASCQEAVKSPLSTHAKRLIVEMLVAQETTDNEQKVLAWFLMFVCLFIETTFCAMSDIPQRYLCACSRWSV
jgi:hypothetical protein